MRFCFIAASAWKMPPWLGLRAAPPRPKPLPRKRGAYSYRAACGIFVPAAASAPVAQLDRAPDYESGGQEFESLRARHIVFDSQARRLLKKACEKKVQTRQS